MTKLEEEIFNAIKMKNSGLTSAQEEYLNDGFKEDAKAAAEVAKRYIEKAWLDSKPQFTPKPTGSGYNIHELNYNHWLKDNGVI